MGKSLKNAEVTVGHALKQQKKRSLAEKEVAGKKRGQ